jgi:hypothetical protein
VINARSALEPLQERECVFAEIVQRAGEFRCSRSAELGALCAGEFSDFAKVISKRLPTPLVQIVF